MAILTANRSLNQETQLYGGFVEYTEITDTRISLTTEHGTTQQFDGVFVYDSVSGILIDGFVMISFMVIKVMIS